MSEKFFNSIIAAIIGCLSAIGTVWFISDEPEISKNSEKYSQLEVDSLKVNHHLTIYSPDQTEEPLIELKNGLVFAQNGVYSENIGALQITGQKVQITTGDPTSETPPIFSELSTNEDGGAYFALLSPKGTHSINFGFDKLETGYIISQNNQDNSMKAQAILSIPQIQDSQNSDSSQNALISQNVQNPQNSQNVLDSQNIQSGQTTNQEQFSSLAPAGNIPPQTSAGVENNVSQVKNDPALNPLDNRNLSPSPTPSNSLVPSEPETAMSSGFSNIPETRIH